MKILSLAAALCFLSACSTVDYMTPPEQPRYLQSDADGKPVVNDAGQKVEVGHGEPQGD